MNQQPIGESHKLHSEPTLWSQYQQLIELHKFYFECNLKAAGFSFGIIGAILVYVIGAKLDAARVSWALSFPLMVSIGTAAVFCAVAVKTVSDLRSVKDLQSPQKLSLEWRPHVEVLGWMSVIFAMLFLIVTVGLGWLVFDPSMLPTPPPGQ